MDKAPIEIHLLESLRLYRFGKKSSLSPARAPRLWSAIAYLAYPDEDGLEREVVKRRVATRSELIAVLWVGANEIPADPKGAFRGVLRALRDQLEEGMDAGTVLRVEGEELSLTDEVKIDVDRFFVDLWRPKPMLAPLDQAKELIESLSLIYGMLMPSVTIGTSNYWVDKQRKHLADTFLKSLEVLVSLLEKGHSGSALLVSEALKRIQVDSAHLWPFPIEDCLNRFFIARMKLYLLCGLPQQAIEQFDELTKRLKQADVVPSPDARIVWDRARQTALDNHPSRSQPLLHGREVEIKEVHDILRRKPPLVTVVGPPGVGKTRFASEVVKVALEWPASARITVRLQSLTTSDHIPDAIMDQLSVYRTDMASLDEVVTALGQMPYLLLLDNIEHLLPDAASVVFTLLKRVPSLTCLVTSRERLVPLKSERSWEQEELVRLQPLPVPPENVSFDRVKKYASVNLFVERAHAAKADFYITAQNANDVANLCRLLDGLPLALTLVAEWLPTHTPARICKEMGEILQKPSPTRSAVSHNLQRDDLTQYATLHAAIEGSYKRLTLSQATLFKRLSVFRGGWMLDAAQAICGDAPSDVAPDLVSLWHHSLVEEDISSEERRFYLLEGLRTFGIDELEVEEWNNLSRRHAEFFAALAVRTLPDLNGKGQVQALNMLAAEHDNFRAAIEWCALTQETSIAYGLPLVANLWRYWQIRGYNKEAHRHLELILERVKDAPPLPELAQALSGLGFMFHLQGNQKKARVQLKKSYRIYRALGDLQGQANIHHHLGLSFQRQADYAQAGRCFQRRLKIERQSNNTKGIAEGLFALGQLAFVQGDDQAAKTHLREGKNHMYELLALFELVEHKRGIAVVLNDLGRITERQHKLEKKEQSALLHDEAGEDTTRLLEARDYYEQALDIFRALGDYEGITNVTHNIAVLARQQNDYPRARQLYRQSLLRDYKIGHLLGIAETLGSISILDAYDKRTERAAVLAGAEDGIRSQIGSTIDELYEGDNRKHRRQLQEKLGSRASELMEQGSRMSVKKAVEYALEESLAVLEE